MNKRFLDLIIIIIIIFAVFLLEGCDLSTQGIPHGIYNRLDDQGNIINEGAEGAWTIQKGEAEYRYLKYKIIKKNGEIYFEIERMLVGSTTEAESGLFQYEVKYNKRTKILTVFMPSNDGIPYHLPTTEFNIKKFQFKNVSNNIG